MIVVLQGRVRSTRLPGKGFFTFFGQTIWERMCDIALAVRGVEEVVFATGDVPENHLIRSLVERKGVRFIAGPEENVLERYCRAIGSYSGEYLVRITCDNYLVQPEAVEGLCAATKSAGADYGYVEPLSHFAGEVVLCDALRRCFTSCYSNKAMEHVTWDIRCGADYSKVALPADYLGLDHTNGLTLDTIEDLIRMKQLEQNTPGLLPVRCLDSLRLVMGSRACAGSGATVSTPAKRSGMGCGPTSPSGRSKW